MLGSGRTDLSAPGPAWRFAAPFLLALAFVLALAAPAGAMFGQPSTISVDGVMASQQRIATDSQNNALAVWTEDDSGVHRVHAAFRPAGGDFESLGFLSAAGGEANQPLVAFDERDNALVVWTQYEGPFEGALGQVQAAFRPAGGTFGEAQTISAGEPGVDYFEPQIGLDESATVVWTRVSATGDLSVQASFRPKDGSFGAPQTLSGAGPAYEPHVVVDERGNSLAVWTEEIGGVPEVRSAFRPRTGNWSTGARISAEGRAAFSPRVAVDGHSNIIAVWTADDGSGGGNSFIQAALRPEGGSFGTLASVSSEVGIASDPQVAFDERDNALLAWSRYDGSSTRIETTFHPRSGGFDVPQTISPAGRDGFEPQIAVDESAAVAWTESEGSQLRVQGAFRMKNGRFGGAQTLSDPGDPSFDPALAIDHRGNVLALWTRNELEDFPVVQFSFRPRVGSFGEPATLSVPETGAFEPQVATDCWGNVMAVWTVDSDLNNESNPTWVEAAFGRTGGGLGPAQRLSDPTRNASEPQVAFESDGDAVVTWSGQDSDGTQRVHAAFRPAGNGFLPPVLLSADGADAFNPKVSAERGTVVVWSRAGAMQSTEASVKPEDESFLPYETLSSAGEDTHAPQVAVGKDGTTVATWYAGNGDHVAASIGRTTSAGFGPATTLSAPDAAASIPQVAVDAQGAALVVWRGGANAFIQAAFRPRRASFGAAQTLASDEVDEPQVAFDESGDALLAWTRYVDGLGQIETASRPRGGVFGPAQTISDTGLPLDNFSPRIAVEYSAAVVWTATTPTGLLRVQSAFRPKDGTFGPVQTLTDRLLFGYEPDVAVDERGNATALWTLTDRFDPGPPAPASAVQSAFRPRA